MLERLTEIQGAFALIWHEGALGDFIVSEPALSAFAENCGFSVFGIGSSIGWSLSNSISTPIKRADFDRAQRQALFGSTPKIPDAWANCKALLTFQCPESLRQLFKQHFQTRFTDIRYPPHHFDSQESASHDQYAATTLHQQLPEHLRSCTHTVPKIQRAMTHAHDSAVAKLVIHIGASSARKRIRVTAMLENLQCDWHNRGMSFEVDAIFGPDDADQFAAEIAEVQQLSQRYGWQCERCDSLDALRSRLSKGAYFIGFDSGPGHLAAALGLHGVSIFTQGNPTIWAPRSDQGKITVVDLQNTPQKSHLGAVKNAFFRLVQLTA